MAEVKRCRCSCARGVRREREVALLLDIRRAMRGASERGARDPKTDTRRAGSAGADNDRCAMPRCFMSAARSAAFDTRELRACKSVAFAAYDYYMIVCRAACRAARYDALQRVMPLRSILRSRVVFAMFVVV